MSPTVTLLLPLLVLISPARQQSEAPPQCAPYNATLVPQEEGIYSLDDWGEEKIVRRVDGAYLVVKSAEDGGVGGRLCQGVVELEGVAEVVAIEAGVTDIEDGAFGKGEKGYCVRLQWNRLKYIKAGVFSSTNIVALNVSSNQIEHIDSDAFDDMPLLETVILDNNKLERWNPDWFMDAPSLHEVSVVRNLISNLPEHTLKNINGSYSIEFSTGLSSVDFGFNRIASIHPEAFDDQKVFGKIILESNSLTAIAPEVFDTLDVYAIAIDNNPIGCFSNETLHSWKKIQLVEIAGIELRPECVEILEEFRKNNKKPYIFEEIDLIA